MKMNSLPFFILYLSSCAYGDPCSSPETLIVIAPGKSGTSTLAALLSRIANRNDFELIDTRGGEPQHPDAKAAHDFYHDRLARGSDPDQPRRIWISHSELHDWMLHLADHGVIGLLTILREPIARSRSMYEYFRRAGLQGDPVISWEDCFGSAGNCTDPTRLFGASQHEMQIQLFDGIERSRYLAECSGRPSGPCALDHALDQDEYLRNATARLRRVDAIAVLEDWEASLAHFERTFPSWLAGLGNAFRSSEAAHLNSAPARRDNSSERVLDRRPFESDRRNFAELSFYESAKQIRSSQLQASCEPTEMPAQRWARAGPLGKLHHVG